MSILTLTQQRGYTMDRKQARASKAKALSKFQRIAALNRMQDEGGEAATAAGKAKKALNNHWERRVSNNNRGFYSAKNAKPGVCMEVH